MNKLFAHTIAVIAASAALALIAPPSALAVPDNLQRTEMLSGDLDFPTSLAFAPDGRMFIAQLGGSIRVYQNEELLPSPLVSIPVTASVDRGMLGIALDPEFERGSPYLYMYYVDSNTKVTIGRVNASSNNATSVETLYTAPQNTPGQHVGGTIAFGPDGKMYASIGDNQNPPNSQDPTNPYGSVIRLNKDGTIPNDNPFANHSDYAQEIYAYGFRNPFRMTFHPTNGHLYVGDVGQSDVEEVNLVKSGKNYGWPSAEGSCNCSEYEDPVYEYPHVNNSGSITLGTIYAGGNFPQEYQGDLFISDYSLGHVRHLSLNSDGTVANSTQISNYNWGSIVDIKQGLDGALYMPTVYPSKIIKLSSSSSNQLPIAKASASAYNGASPLYVEFSSQGSYDPDGDQLSYTWDFGDSTTSTQTNPNKIYTNPGSYTVKLTINDGQSSITSDPITIQVGDKPVVAITTPQNGKIYRAGDTVSYTVNATDSQGNTLPDSAVSVKSILHHDEHTHPHSGPFIGKSGNITIPTRGETSSNTWYAIIATATNSAGVSTETTTHIYPEVSFLAIQTQPVNLNIAVDGQPKQTPYTTPSVVGFERLVSAPEYTTDASGNSYKFLNWQHGGQREQYIATSQSGLNLVAIYQLDDHDSSSKISASFWNLPNSSSYLNQPPEFPNRAADKTFEAQEINNDWGLDAPAPGIQADRFMARWQTNLRVDSAGVYEFSTTSDDGIRVLVDNELVINEWNDHSATNHTTKIDLLPGDYTVTVEYYENGYDAVAKASWHRLGDSEDDDDSDHREHNHAYQARYWNLSPGAFSGPPSIPQSNPDHIGDEQEINHNWGQGSPLPGKIQSDMFVAEWNKHQYFNGTYQFTASSDDGVRVFIGDDLIIDQWKDQGSTTYRAVRTLVGVHDITVQYYENGGDAVMQFAYQEQPSNDDDPNDCQLHENNLVANSGFENSNESAPSWNTYSWGGAEPSYRIDNTGCENSNSLVLASSSVSGGVGLSTNAINTYGLSNFKYSSLIASDERVDVTVQAIDANNKSSYIWLGAVSASQGIQQVDLELELPQGTERFVVRHSLGGKTELHIDNVQIYY